MVDFVEDQGKQAVLFNVPNANESMFPPAVAKELREKRDYHNAMFDYQTHLPHVKPYPPTMGYRWKPWQFGVNLAIWQYLLEFPYALSRDTVVLVRHNFLSWIRPLQVF